MAPTTAASSNAATQPPRAIPTATTAQSRNVSGQNDHHGRLVSHDDPLIDEDGDEVFSNPDTAELESRSDATGATSPTPNSPGPGSPSNRLSASHHVTVVSPAALDQMATLKQHDFTSAMGTAAGNAGANTNQHGGKSMALGPLPQTNIALLQQQFDAQTRLDHTPRPTANSANSQLSNSTISPSSANTAASLTTPTKGTSSSRPTFGRAISASGATMQTLSSSMHPAHSMTGSSGRFGPSTPRLGGHGTSQSVSNFSVPYNQLPSAHGLPNDPHEASTLSKLFAHPPAQSPAEELQAFSFGSDRVGRRSSVAIGQTPPNVAGSTLHAHRLSTPSAYTASTARRLSRPSTRPSSPDRFMSPSRKSTKRASVTAAGLGLSPRLGAPTMLDSTATDAVADSQSSIFERDIEHRDASHVLSKQEAIDVAIPSVLDDAVEAIQSDAAEQVEVITPHAILPPLALSMQALSAHSNSQTKLNQSSSATSRSGPIATAQRSCASSPHMSPSPPLSNAGAPIEPPPGSMAAQIAERLANNAKAANAANASSIAHSPIQEGDSAARGLSRHRRPNSDVSNISSTSSSMRSRSPKQLSVGVQQVLAASNTSQRSPVGAPSVSTSRTAETQPLSNAGASATASPCSTILRGPLPTATALPALPLPNPFRAYSPSTSNALLPDVGSSSMLPSVSMDGAVMPSSESATLDASLVNLADVIASQPPTSSNSLANSPNMRIRGLGFEDGMYEASPYSVRPAAPMLTTSGVAASGKAVSQPASPLTGRSSVGHAKSSSNVVKGEEGISSSSSLANSKKRLSFFSYADIINQTPAEVMRFDEAVRQPKNASAAAACVSPSSTSVYTSSNTLGQGDASVAMARGHSVGGYPATADTAK